MNMSKSKYTTGIRCAKELWLSIYKPSEIDNNGSDSIMDNGNRVGELARSLFGKYALVSYDENNIKSMVDETKKYLDEKVSIICEASFIYDGNFCSVDILKNDIDGVEIYEVKSSTEIKEIYIDDISYQAWVLKMCGLNIKKASIVYVNSSYVREKEFDISKYFISEDVTSKLNVNVETEVGKLKGIINCDIEPNIDVSKDCKGGKKVPFDCPFFKYCTMHLPTPNVFDIGWNTRFEKKLDMYYKGKITYGEILEDGGLNPKADLQMQYELNNLEPKINALKIKELLSEFSFPLYFLDFESYQDPIPSIIGTKPYQQICFQYSLHYYLEEDGTLYHKEYLSDDYDGNPMYGLCKQLCEDIPMNTCILVYNQSFEITRLREMANLFPEFRDHLLNIADNIKDLLPPFKNQDYYVKEMGGSASIKKVLPALFPNDPSLDYHNLDQVHKGDEASASFLLLKSLNADEQHTLRENMLKYCCLDTYAMVKIWQKLNEIIK